jgi:NAD(P)-dependent dehydrogenase (short-subunit alcohol dehydrogenase family)
MTWDDRRVYVTGGGSGIGLRLAELLVARGAHVALFDLRLADGVVERVEAARPQPERRARGYLADVADAGATAGAFRRAAEEVGPPDLVFNSAGISCPRAFADLAQEDFERVVRVNLFGSRNVAAAALPLLRPGGCIALVASLAAIAPGYGYTAYGASKAGVLAFAEALRSELAPRGLAVTVVCPPEVATPLVAWSRTVRPAPTERLTRFAGSLGLDEACAAILRGLERGGFLVIPGRRAQLAYALSRLLPKRLAHALSDRIVAKALAEPQPAARATKR